MVGEAMELTAWPNDYGLVSVDTECLRQIAYMKFANVPFNLKYDTNPMWSADGSFPIFKDGEYVFTKFAPTVEHLRFNRYSLDFGLSNKSCSEMLAFMSMVSRMLEPISEFVFWVDKRNFEEHTRPWHMKVMSPLFNAIYVRKRRNKATDLLTIIYPALDTEIAIHNHLKTVATECFQILNSRLGSLQFFYGSGPSSLDCTVYAYLAPLIKVPLPSNEITSLIQNWPNLLSYIKRIDDQFFPGLSQNAMYLKPHEDANEEIKASLRLKVCMFTFVLCAIIGYAVSNNIIEIPEPMLPKS